MNSEVNHNSSSYQSTSYFINHPRDLGDKIEHTLSIHCELVEALRKHGCSNCVALLRDIVRKNSSYNHQEGGKLIIEKDNGVRIH
jgi:hypothetical protein